jgi:ADP-ribose pyrophosphatase YjhB (NUDIX family)
LLVTVPMVYLAIALVGLGLAAAIAWRARGEDSDPDGKWSSAGGVVSDGEGRIALVLQRDRSRRLRWTLPKGRIDPGETAETAALREVHEESGLRARIVGTLLIHEGPRHFTHYFEMILLRDDGRHDAETKEVRFVSLERAAKMMRGDRDLSVLRRLVEQRTRVRAGA